jgi:multisubunit Na+/H+ antiporter MnhB subunit
VAGAITAKLLKTGAITVIVVAFRERPRTEAALLVMYTAVGVAGAVVNTLVA